MAVAACARSDDKIDIVHDPCAPMTLAASAPTDVQQRGVDAAQALWRDHGAPALGSGGVQLEVVFEDAAHPFHGFYDDVQGIVYINRDLVDESVLAIVIAHELGHAFGLFHVSDRVSVMNPGNLTTTPNDADQGALELLWGACATPLR